MSRERVAALRAVMAASEVAIRLLRRRIWQMEIEGYTTEGEDGARFMMRASREEIRLPRRRIAVS